MPRLRLAGDTGSLDKFGNFLSGRSLEKGTSVILFYRVEGVLEVALLPPGATDYSQVIQPPDHFGCKCWKVAKRRHVLQ